MTINRKWLYLAAVVFVLLVGRIWGQAITATTPAMFIGVGVHTSCLASSAGQANLCLAGDGLWLSTNGGAYVQVGAASGTGTVTSVTINGVTKAGATPSFTLTGTTTAPGTTVTAQ